MNDLKEHIEPVTYADVQNAIEEFYFYTAEDGLKGAGVTPKRFNGKMVIHCVVMLKNGFEITTSAIAGSWYTHDRKRGEDAAFAKAVSEIYSHLYYERMVTQQRITPVVDKLVQHLPDGK